MAATNEIITKFSRQSLGTSDELAKAYRKLAMKYHPIPTGMMRMPLPSSKKL